jgi:hypothetical protein
MELDAWTPPHAGSRGVRAVVVAVNAVAVYKSTTIPSPPLLWN